jgi:drug/metabolite transporter superfamily protein YnfA
MATWLAYGVLLAAAILESGGDALVRLGLHSPISANRIGFFAAGAVVLFLYGLTVNAPNWDFGRLLGVYVTLFFVTAQVINLIVFHVRPGAPILVGGALIVAGGLVMTLWRTT